MDKQTTNLDGKTEDCRLQNPTEVKDLELKVGSTLDDIQLALRRLRSDLLGQTEQFVPVQDQGAGDYNDLWNKLKSLKDEISSLQTKQKLLTKENSESILAIKANMDGFIKNLNYNNSKLNQKLNLREAYFKKTIDYYKVQLKQSQNLIECQRKRLEELETSIIDNLQLTDVKEEMASVNDDHYELIQSDSYTEIANEKIHRDLLEKLDWTGNEIIAAIELLKWELAEVKVKCDSKDTQMASKLEELSRNLQLQLTKHTEKLTMISEELTLKLNESESAMKTKMAEMESNIIGPFKATTDVLHKKLNQLYQLNSHQQFLSYKHLL